MGLFVGDSQPSKIFVGDTQISKVFLGDTQVRPSYTPGPWTPGANTKLYIPFNNNYNDEIGNTVTLQLGTAPTYSTTAQSETYANISSSAIGTTINGLDINTWTVSQWLYKTSTSVDVVWFFGGNSIDPTGTGTGMFINNKRLNIFVYNQDIDTLVDITLNARHNVIFTANNGKTKVYVDGDLKNTLSKTYVSGGGNFFRILSNPLTAWQERPPWIANPYVGRYDELIVEDKEWSLDDVNLYYRSTKSNYGL